MAKSSAEDKPLNCRIGYSVMRARKRSGMEIAVLAERAGIHKNTLNRVEAGYGATAATLFKIANALDLSIDELIPKAQYVVSFQTRGKKPAKVSNETKTLF